MTPSALRRLLQELPGSWPPVSETAGLLRALEEAADRDPARRDLAAAVAHAHAMATADADLPALVGGVRRDALVRWDAWTTTWTGSDVASGARTLLRVVRPALARDPVVRRALRRDARVLGHVDAEVRWVEHPLPALRRPLPGLPFEGHPSDGADAGTLVRLLCTGLAALQRWERAGLSTPGLDPAEWSITGDRLTIACLTIGEAPGAIREDLRGLSLALQRWAIDVGTTAIDAELDGFALFPPDAVEEAAERVQRALATALARTRHHLVRARVAVRAEDEQRRLVKLLRRLQRAVDPPVGVGAVGVDLDGRIRSVRSARGLVTWGPHGEPGTPIRDAHGQLQPAEARRLLRARAAAPPNPRLQAAVGGDEAFTEAICRWVACAHHLRTLVMLAEKAPGG